MNWKQKITALLLLCGLGGCVAHMSMEAISRVDEDLFLCYRETGFIPMESTKRWAFGYGRRLIINKEHSCYLYWIEEVVSPDSVSLSKNGDYIKKYGKPCGRGGLSQRINPHYRITFIIKNDMSLWMSKDCEGGAVHEDQPVGFPLEPVVVECSPEINREWTWSNFYHPPPVNLCRSVEERMESQPR